MVRFWDLERRDVEIAVQAHDSSIVALDRLGNTTLVSVASDGGIVWINAANGKITARAQGEGWTVAGANLTAAEHIFLHSKAEPIGQFVDAKNGQPVKGPTRLTPASLDWMGRLAGDEQIYVPYFAIDERRVVVALSNRHGTYTRARIGIWDFEANQVRQNMGSEAGADFSRSSPIAMALMANSALVTAEFGVVERWNLATLRCEQRVQITSRICSVFASPHSHGGWFCGLDDGSIWAGSFDIWAGDFDSGGTSRLLAETDGQAIRTLAAIPGGRQLAAAGDGGRIHVIDF